MTVYSLGKFLVGPDKVSECYFVHKKTGCFLLIKQNSRTKFTYRLKKYIGTMKRELYFTPEVTEIEYKKMIYSYDTLLPLSILTTSQILQIISDSSLFELVKETKLENKEITKVSSVASELYTYKLEDGTVLSGALNSIIDLCKKLGETVNINKIEGIDVSKFYYSNSKEEWIEISKMATPYIMNSIIKNARDYYDTLKTSKECSVEDFFKLMEKWIENPVTKSLADELTKRG